MKLKTKFLLFYKVSYFFTECTSLELSLSSITQWKKTCQRTKRRRRLPRKPEEEVRKGNYNNSVLIHGHYCHSINLFALDVDEVGKYSVIFVYSNASVN